LKGQLPILFALFILFFSCQPYKDSPIVGEWNAVLIQEFKKVEELEPTTRNYLFFTSGGDYIFENELNQNEKGTFSLKDSLLVTKDISKKPAVERRMKVAKLNSDTLLLEMKNKYGHLNKVMFLRIDREVITDSTMITEDSSKVRADGQIVATFKDTTTLENVRSIPKKDLKERKNKVKKSVLKKPKVKSTQKKKRR